MVELIKFLGLNREEVLVTVNGSLVTEDYALKEGDSVRILSVISGG